MFSRSETANQRRIFQKKQSFEADGISDKRMKIMKKYSHNIEI
jgi:peroxiredoxin